MKETKPKWLYHFLVNRELKLTKWLSTLPQGGIAVFYDDFEKVSLWGQNLAEVFHKAFEKQSNFVVIFISQAYVEKP